jgi:hypothetical protein
MSRLGQFGKNFVDKINVAIGKDVSKDASAADPKESVESAPTENEINEESTLLVILDHVRQLYIERRLIGSIEVSTTIFAIYNSVECNIDEAQFIESEGLEEKIVENKKLTRIQKIAIGGLEGMMKTLHFRARAYKNKSYKDSITISNGIYHTFPMSVFGLSVICSATVDSLLKYEESIAKEKLIKEN